MKTLSRLFLLLVAGMALSCSSGDDDPGCEFTDPTVLADAAAAPWPKFRRDVANTGRSTANIGENPGTLRWMFPPEPLPALGPITGSPVVGKGDIVLFGGPGASPESSQAAVYRVDGATGRTDSSAIQLAEGSTVTNAPLLGDDGSVFVGVGDGALLRYRTDDTAYYVANLGGFNSASPNIGEDGTIYQGTLSGLFWAVCPNGIARFSIGLYSTRSTAAVARDRSIVIAADDGQIRSFTWEGELRWLFRGSSAIAAAVTIDDSDPNAPGDPSKWAFFAADTQGHVFSGSLSDGRLLWRTKLPSGAGVTAAPALGAAGSLYVADEGGRIYALDRASGAYRWEAPFDSGGAIYSSPAVATDGAHDVIVVGNDAGVVLAITDLGDSPALRWTYPAEGSLDPVGHSSPAIGSDGTVYIGTTGGRFYAIGGPPAPTATTTASPSPTPTPSPG